MLCVVQSQYIHVRCTHDAKFYPTYIAVASDSAPHGTECSEVVSGTSLRQTPNIKESTGTVYPSAYCVTVIVYEELHSKKGFVTLTSILVI